MIFYQIKALRERYCSSVFYRTPVENRKHLSVVVCCIIANRYMRKNVMNNIDSDVAPSCMWRFHKFVDELSLRAHRESWPKTVHPIEHQIQQIAIHDHCRPTRPQRRRIAKDAISLTSNTQCFQVRDKLKFTGLSWCVKWRCSGQIVNDRKGAQLI